MIDVAEYKRTRDDTREAIPEQRLFQMVIVQAVGEALAPRRQGTQAARNALRWILTDDDFDFACELAGWDTFGIRRKVSKLLEEAKVTGKPTPTLPRRPYVNNGKRGPTPLIAPKEPPCV
jgi:hypothetical protein